MCATCAAAPADPAAATEAPPATAAFPPASAPFPRAFDVFWPPQAWQTIPTAMMPRNRMRGDLQSTCQAVNRRSCAAGERRRLGLN